MSKTFTLLDCHLSKECCIDGEILYPQTITDQVFLSDGSTLTEWINSTNMSSGSDVSYSGAFESGVSLGTLTIDNVANQIYIPITNSSNDTDYGVIKVNRDYFGFNASNELIPYLSWSNSASFGSYFTNPIGYIDNGNGDHILSIMMPNIALSGSIDSSNLTYTISVGGNSVSTKSIAVSSLATYILSNSTLQSELSYMAGNGINISDRTISVDTSAISGETNIIEEIDLNGSALAVSNKTVNIPLFGGATNSADGSLGLVPAPTASDVNNFLSGNGTWASIDVFDGATSTTNGNAGLVPAPTANLFLDKFLCCNGAWSNINLSNVANDGTSYVSTIGGVRVASTPSESNYLITMRWRGNSGLGLQGYAYSSPNYRWDKDFDTSTEILLNDPQRVYGRYYAVELDSYGVPFVNVPWSSGGEIAVATTSSIGGIMTGYTENSNNYAVNVDASGNAYVTVPSSTATVATDSTLGSIMIGFSQSGRNYPVLLNANNKAYVNVPWTDTTYSNATTSSNGLMSASDKMSFDSMSTKLGNMTEYQYCLVSLEDYRILVEKNMTTNDCKSIAGGSYYLVPARNLLAMSDQ